MLCDINGIQDAEKRAVADILSAIARGESTHSYIIEGGSAHSRLKCAVISACAIICENKQKDKFGVMMPCFNCRQCKKLLENEHSDIEILGMSKDGGQTDIKIDDVRAIRKSAYVLPTECEKHIYILCGADKMNTASQNALLKILEEPPETTVFFLLTPSKELLLPTVTSRAQSHTLGISSLEETAAEIKTIYPDNDETWAKRLAKIQRFFDKLEMNPLLAAETDRCYELVIDYYVNGNKRIIEELPQKKDQLAFTLGVLGTAARDIAVAKRYKGPGVPVFVFEKNADFEKACSRFSLKKALELEEAFRSASERVNQYGNINTVLAELFSVLR